MSTNQERDPTEGILFSLRIIHLALAVGVAGFLVIAVGVMRKGIILGKDPWAVTNPMTLIALAFGIVTIIAHVFIPKLIVNARRVEIARSKPGDDRVESDAEGMTAIYMTQMIIGSALIEGAAFFNTIVYSLEGTVLPLLLAVLLLGILISRIPTRSSMTAWLEAHLVRLREERHLG